MVIYTEVLGGGLTCHMLWGACPQGILKIIFHDIEWVFGIWNGIVEWNSDLKIKYS